jgi:hypothetical protein
MKEVENGEVKGKHIYEFIQIVHLLSGWSWKQTCRQTKWWGGRGVLKENPQKCSACEAEEKLPSNQFTLMHLCEQISNKICM